LDTKLRPQLIQVHAYRLVLHFCVQRLKNAHANRAVSHCDLGGVGPHAIDSANMAGGLQESASLPQHRRNLQAARSLAGEAGAGIHCGDAANDGASEIGYQEQLEFAEQKIFESYLTISASPGVANEHASSIRPKKFSE
jgi:hypothetical protein